MSALTRAFRSHFVLPDILREEFADYNSAKFRRDLLAGAAGAAVALPLALAFGVASGATAAAGLITAIIAGFVIGALSGSAYHISGPTGAMAAVLIVLAQRYGLSGMWTAGLLAGIIILLMGIFDLGQIVNFIPSAVIAGFTSGIALVILVGQLDNILGIKTTAADNSLAKLLGYLHFGYIPNWTAVAATIFTILIMAFWPKKMSHRFPGSLIALTAMTAVAVLLRLTIPTIGTIPQSIILDARLLPTNIPWDHLGELIAPAFSIAALGAIESLLCGTAISRMPEAKHPFVPNQELIAQGIGNIIIPFFGGVPATAAIARTAVAIKSGGQTRVVTFVHASLLLIVVLVLGPVLSHVPMAVLGGILAVTTYRMNDWAEIRWIFEKRFKSAMIAFTVTLLATAALDLTQAIIIGVGLSAMVFVVQISRTKIVISPVLPDKLREDGYEMKSDGKAITVVYVVGPIFFGTTATIMSTLHHLHTTPIVILSLRTVPLLDTTGVGVLEDFIHIVETNGGQVFLCGLNEPVERYLSRAGVLTHLGKDKLFWDAFEAIVAADRMTIAIASAAAIPQPELA